LPQSHDAGSGASRAERKLRLAPDCRKLAGASAAARGCSEKGLAARCSAGVVVREMPAMPFMSRRLLPTSRSCGFAVQRFWSMLRPAANMLWKSRPSGLS